MNYRSFIRGVTLFLCSVSACSYAADSLVSKAVQQQKQESKHNQQREAGFKQTEKTLQATKNRLALEKKKLQQQVDLLSAQFSNNETRLAQLEDKLRLETGSLGEVFGVVRLNAKNLQSYLSRSITQADRHRYSGAVDEIVNAQALPSLSQLKALWQSFSEQIKASEEITRFQIPYIDHSGERHQVTTARLGTFGLVTQKGYVAWEPEKQVVMSYLKQPEDGPVLDQISGLLTGQTQILRVDPSQGTLLAQLANVPDLMDRVKSGGVVGYIILTILAIGLLIALIRGATLLFIRQKINAQLKHPEAPGNNPLGRILSVYDQEKHQSVEALELRLLEAVMDEQVHLERGLSMLKLLAALAPMLGLLGTVTGMIETFQVITQFGNGDPKVMAGGISMALVTTVLGLISAMPMLLAHNILSSQAESIRMILEKQGIGIVAGQAEKDADLPAEPQAI
ncbi:Biopolymer transport protein ExbB [Vibrio aerogenes CECT 7868]|uniref:Biopolymer transport protein ExbB n=1 Tax=Vibrio aerogenes CECT 7868 TaxID=1216006 RepID=A0A1M5Z765_9VIBR|nr:MotA/TolQ/ExbB proton channel family protein [Vibrio aerogenes]SHI20097.1 Biopolymer transport protein ExbB [Vibrio aerogenes CECT 7868]